MLRATENHFILCVIILTAILVAACSYDLFSPPISKTVWRQTQTAMLTENFAKEGFSLNGLHLNITGREKPLMIYEFPIYNFVVGLIFLVTDSNPFWGKAVSLFCSILCMLFLIANVRRQYGKRLSLVSGFFFVFSPVGLMMYTSFQPDAFGLMFVMISLWLLARWTQSRSILVFVLFALTLLVAGLAKYPLLVPYLPLMALVLFPKTVKMAVQDIKFLPIFLVLFVVPLFSWYLYSRMFLTDYYRSSQLLDSMFLIGDLTRFLSPSYYIKMGYTIPFLCLSGLGSLFFVLGLRKLDAIQVALLVGIPFYLIIIPTVKDQWYYLLACVPIFSLFMAKGFISIVEWSISYKRKVILAIFTTLFLMGFALCASFTLSRENVLLESANALNRVSHSNDLVFFVNLHNRAIGIGSANPSLSYLSRRNGWNVELEGGGWKTQYKGFDVQDIINQIEKNSEKGAKWVLVTYYTNALEPWISAFIPKQYQRDPSVTFPGVDGGALIKRLREQMNMPIEVEGPNFVIFRMIK